MGKKSRRRKRKFSGIAPVSRLRLPLAPPGIQPVKIPIKVKRVADVGTGNPIVARLQMQMFDLVDALGLQKPDRERILEHTFVGSQWFLRAEKNKDEYRRLSHMFTRRAGEGSGVRVSGSALVVQEPLNLGDYYQLFLIDLTIGLRLFFKATGIILRGTPTGWHGLKTAIEQGFAAVHPLRILMATHGQWSKTLLDDRGDVEHDPYMFTGFRVGMDEQDNYLLFRPVGSNQQPFEDIMETYLQDGFTFAEELVAFAIQSRLPTGRQLEEIPEAQRNPRAPIRFRLS